MVIKAWHLEQTQWTPDMVWCWEVTAEVEHADAWNKNCNSMKGRPNRPQYCCICHGTSTRSCTWRGNECRSSSQRWTCIWHRLVKWWRSRRQEWTEQTLKLNCDCTRDLWSQLGNKRGRYGGQGQIAMAVAEVEAGTSGSVIGGRESAKASVATGKEGIRNESNRWWT